MQGGSDVIVDRLHTFCAVDLQSGSRESVSTQIACMKQFWPIIIFIYSPLNGQIRILILKHVILVNLSCGSSMHEAVYGFVRHSSTINDCVEDRKFWQVSACAMSNDLNASRNPKHATPLIQLQQAMVAPHRNLLLKHAIVRTPTCVKQQRCGGTCDATRVDNRYRTITTCTTPSLGCLDGVSGRDDLAATL